MAELWSDYTDAIIKEVDKQIGGKFRFSISDFLTDVPKYASEQSIEVTISNMREAANSHIDELLQGLPQQVKALGDSIAKANAITKQLSQNISMQAKQHDVPFIKPLQIDRNTANEETITINTVDDQAIKLMEKLTSTSNLVADFSYQYKDSWIGSWFFSGNKDYTVSVYVPQSDAFSLELSRIELNGLFDAAANYIKGY